VEHFPQSHGTLAPLLTNYQLHTTNIISTDNTVLFCSELTKAEQAKTLEVMSHSPSARAVAQTCFEQEVP
jgi:hypothetical protein